MKKYFILKKLYLFADSSVFFKFIRIFNCQFKKKLYLCISDRNRVKNKKNK